MKNYPTLIHERVALSNEEKNPTVVCRMESGWFVLGDDQRLEGYSLLLSDPVVDDLNSLSGSEREQFLRDMALIGDCLKVVLNPSIVNYAIFGNTDRALHAHIHPRYDTEEKEKRRTVPFIYHIEGYPYVPFSEERHAALKERLYQAMVALGGVSEKARRVDESEADV